MRTEYLWPKSRNCPVVSLMARLRDRRSRTSKRRSSYGSIQLGSLATPCLKIGADIMKKELTAIIEREGGGYVSLCPELDIASQGSTIEEARQNLREAIELFFETASQSEIQTRLHEEVYVTRVEVSVG